MRKWGGRGAIREGEGEGDEREGEGMGRRWRESWVV